MKILAVSMLANFALVVVLAVRPSFAPPAVEEVLVNRLKFGATARTESTETASSRPLTESTTSTSSTADRESIHSLGSYFNPGDFVVLSARIRAAGFPPAVAAEILRREIYAHYDEKLRVLTRPDPSRPFWVTDLESLATSGRRNEQMAQIQRDRDKAYRDAVNDPYYFQDAGLDVGQRRMWGELSREKLDRIQRIEDDYAEMMSVVRAEANGVILPVDQTNLNVLAHEKQVDIHAVLSADELAEYQLRTGSVGLGFTRHLTYFSPTETEWRALVNTQLALNTAMSENGGYFSASPEQQREMRESFESQMRASIGDARFADYLRSTETEFQTLAHLVARDRLPQSAAHQAIEVRDRALAESNRIFEDPTLDTAQKVTALQSLAQDTRTQLLSGLGPNSGPAYLITANRWLNAIGSGRNVTFEPISARSNANGHVTLMGGTAPSIRLVPVVRTPNVTATPPNR